MSYQTLSNTNHAATVTIGSQIVEVEYRHQAMKTDEGIIQQISSEFEYGNVFYKGFFYKKYKVQKGIKPLPFNRLLKNGEWQWQNTDFFPESISGYPLGYEKGLNRAVKMARKKIAEYRRATPQERQSVYKWVFQTFSFVDTLK